MATFNADSRATEMQYYNETKQKLFYNEIFRKSSSFSKSNH